MADSKIFKLIDGVTVDMVGRAVEAFLRDKKGLTVEGTSSPEGYFVQAKETEKKWKKYTGMDMATQVQIIPAGENITVNVGSGKWSDKLGAGAAGMLLFAPLAVTAAIGAWGQKKLPEEIFNEIEHFILSGGKSVSISLGASKALKDDEVLCPQCKTANTKGTKFCANCGGKLTNECPNCHNDVALGIKFCPSCGSSMEKENLCPTCHSKVPEGMKFCPECGSSMEVKNLCPHCNAEIPEGMKFCPECGQSISNIKVCPNCGAEIPEGRKFCGECGTKIDWLHNLTSIIVYIDICSYFQKE